MQDAKHRNMKLDFTKPQSTPSHCLPFGSGFTLCLRILNNLAACVWVEDKDNNILPIASVIDVDCITDSGVVEEPISIHPTEKTHYLIEREKGYIFYYNLSTIILKIHPCRIESDMEWIGTKST